MKNHTPRIERAEKVSGAVKEKIKIIWTNPDGKPEPGQDETKAKGEHIAYIDSGFRDV